VPGVPELAARLGRPVIPLLLPTPYPVGPVWVYLLPDEPVTLVDTGPATPSAWRSLVAQLARHGLKPQDIRRVLVTHGHHDHMGLARRLQQLGAQVYAHPADAHNLALRRHYRQLAGMLRSLGLGPGRRLLMMAGLWLLDRTSRPLLHYTPLAPGDELPAAAGTLGVHHVPGHSPGHVAFELSRENVWLSGDVLLAGILPNAVLEADPEQPTRPYPALGVYRKTLKSLAASPPRALLPAHGPAVTEVQELARSTLARQELRSRQIWEALGPTPKTLATLLARLHPRAKGLGLFLAYSDVYGHLLDMEEQGLVARVTVGGVHSFARSHAERHGTHRVEAS